MPVLLTEASFGETDFLVSRSHNRTGFCRVTSRHLGG